MLARWVRRSAVLGALVTASAALLWSTPSGVTAARTWSSAAADGQLVLVAAVLAWAMLCWLVLAALVSAAAALPRAPGSVATVVAERLAPAVVRRMVNVAMGLAVTVSATGPTAALAAGPPAHASVSVVRTVAGTEPRVVLGERVATSSTTPNTTEPAVDYDRPAVGTLPISAARTARIAVVGGAHRAGTTRDDEGVVVRRGDTLWSIASRELAAGATDAQIQLRWQQWYAHNRAVIGTDPDRISPGIRLARPAAS